MLKKIFVLAACFVFGGLAFADEVFKVGNTLENLQAAFNGESNAKARYEAFAVKADAEGYAQVGSLFRATALAESIHAAKHAKQIEKLGATPVANVRTEEVKSTKENLEAAWKGEMYEVEVMYPAFVKEAERVGNRGAVVSLNGALKTEAGHAQYYKEALGNLEAWKGGTKDFIVCPTCGFITADLSINKCPVCAEPRKKFIDVK